MNALLSSLMLWAVFLPFGGALLLLCLKSTPNLRDGLMVAVSLSTAAAVLSLLFFYDPEHAAPSAFLFTLIQPTDHLSIAFHLEPLGLLFATLASCLWVITGLYAIGYMRANDEKNQTAFFAYFSIAIGSALGIAFAANMLTLFVFYEILTLSTYPLVIHHQTEDAKKGGRFYLTYLLGSSFLFLFLGMIWTWIRAGSLDFTIGGILPQSMSGLEAGLLLALYVFGIGKAALMPVHRWLPEAMVAPTPVSALLHAVAVVKAGVFTVLKVGLYIFGADFLSQKGASEWLIGVACFSILAASVIALTKTDLKARLAYSTVSQLSYVTLAMALATPAAFLARRASYRKPRLRKSLPLYVRRRNPYRHASKRHLPNGRAGARHALHFQRLPSGRAEHHRASPLHRHVEQMAAGRSHHHGRLVLEHMDCHHNDTFKLSSQCLLSSCYSHARFYFLPWSALPWSTLAWSTLAWRAPRHANHSRSAPSLRYPPMPHPRWPVSFSSF